MSEGELGLEGPVELEGPDAGDEPGAAPEAVESEAVESVGAPSEESSAVSAAFEDRLSPRWGSVSRIRLSSISFRNSEHFSFTR